MTYVPIEITQIDFDSILFQNIFALVDEYKVANSMILVQDREKKVTYPLYTIFIPSSPKHFRDNKRTKVWTPISVQIDFDALPGDGDWQQGAEMLNKLEVGLEAQADNLRTAKMRYCGNDFMSAEPIDVNGQQVFCRSISFKFEVLL